jgi:hypothetical protein
MDEKERIYKAYEKNILRLNEAKPDPYKFGRLYLKNTDKKLRKVDDVIREIQKDAKMIDNKLGGTNMFDTSHTLAGQIIGLTTSFYDALHEAIEEIEYAGYHEE